MDNTEIFKFMGYEFKSQQKYTFPPPFHLEIENQIARDVWVKKKGNVVWKSDIIFNEMEWGSTWNNLMEVFEKISQIANGVCEINSFYIIIKHNIIESIVHLEDVQSGGLLEAVYRCILDFCTQYNNNIKSV